MATGTIQLSPDLINSWLFRQLRPTAAPVARVQIPERVETEVAEKAAPVAKELTEEQEIKILAHAAKEFENDFQAVSFGLNNAHGRCFDDVSEAFGQRLGALSTALEAQDRDAIRSAAKRLSLVVAEMQTNIPAWNYVRGLQLLVKRCLR